MDNNKYFEDLHLRFGDYSAANKVAGIYKDYGDKIKPPAVKDTIHLGTIGADFFKNKVLIIDYPNERFAICENIPKEYQDNLIDIEISKSGFVILPMKIHNKSYRITFDNGSSIFPIITNAENISNYSTSADVDTIQISSWGKIHGVTGKLIKDTFELAGQKFSNVKVYANHSGLGIDKETDGMAGNVFVLGQDNNYRFQKQKIWREITLNTPHWLLVRMIRRLFFKIIAFFQISAGNPTDGNGN